MADRCQIDTTFTTTDPEMAGNLIWLNDLPESDPQRHDLMAHLHIVLARACWRRAEEIRQADADHARRSAAARRGKAAPDG